MVQADMTAYRSPGEPLQLGLPDLWAILFIIDYHVSLTLHLFRIGTPEVAQLVSDISAIYSPELHVGITPVRFHSFT